MKFRDVRNLIVGIVVAACVCMAVAPVFALSQFGIGAATHIDTDNVLGEHIIGVRRAYDGEYTHGFSWVNPVDNRKYCFTKLFIGGQYRDHAEGYGYAQTPQWRIRVDGSVREEHGLTTPR